jgi:hypothetical protein
MTSKLKPPGTNRLKLTYDNLLSSFAFKINLRRYNLEALPGVRHVGGGVHLAGPYTRSLLSST